MPEKFINIKVTNKPVVPGNVLLTILFGCLATILFNNGIYLFCCLMTIIGLFALLWRNNRPGILLFAFFMQWTQVISYVIWMNYNDFSIEELSKHAGVAVLMSCLGFLIMAAIIARGINSLAMPSRDQLRAAAALINERKIFILYLGSTLFLSSIGFILGSTSGLAQILVTLSTIKWIFFLIYGYVAWINKKNRIILMAMVLFEFSTALYSYFSSFKEVILFSIILSLTFVKMISFRQFFYSLIISILLGAMLLTWTAIKGEYRNYLSVGKREQVVEVSREDALTKMQQQIGELSWKQYELATNMSLYRLQYVYHLALTMDRVPAVIPYENGKLWWDNITYVLEPRIFFPGKALFEPTAKTNKYTGMNYSGLKGGSAFSLGYFGDGYIDFGYSGMFIPLAILALFIVLVYRTFYKMARLNILFRYGLINVALYNFIYFESDGTFLFGRLLITFLVFWFMAKTMLPRLQYWLYSK
ncbi:MAG TPA: hypothetical protein VK563_15540 [Puia sp.]|nr:hypothetical protein [Puia sp.]